MRSGMMNVRTRAVGAIVVMVLEACSSGGGGGGGGSGSSSSGATTPGPSGSDCSAVGTWHSHFQWNGRTPGDLALVVSAGNSVQIPSAPGVSAATGTASVSGKEISWKMSDGSTMTGTADATCSVITDGTMKSASGTVGQFTARKNACDFDGTWDVAFQWSGRTPGALSIVVAPDQSAEIPSGPGVSAATGTTAIDGFNVTWSMSDGATMTGAADANCQVISSGTMRSKAGTTGVFKAQK